MQLAGIRKLIAESGLEGAVMFLAKALEEYDANFLEQVRRKHFPTKEEQEEDSTNA